jgi:hypothetical protein
MQVDGVSGFSFATVDDFSDGSRCVDGPPLSSLGTISASCALGSAGNAESFISAVAGPLSAMIIGAGSASVSSERNNRLASASASAEVRVRAVGGDLQITVTVLSVNARRRLDGSAVDTITNGPVTFGTVLLDGEDRTFGTSFTCQAIISALGTGTFASGGSCLMELSAEPIPKTTFAWNEPAGGEYHNAAHWIPNCGFPQAAADTAAFGLESPANIAIHGNGAQAGRWIFFGNTWTFTGSAEVLSTSLVFRSLTLQGGGTLFLNGTLRSQHSLIDGISSDSELQVLGAGNWENVGSANIGRGRLRVFGTASTDELLIGTNRGPAHVESTLGGMLTVKRVLTVGDTHAATLDITDGGSLQVDQPGSELAVIGKGAAGTVTLRNSLGGGSSGRLLVNKKLSIGKSSVGKLFIHDGGYVRAGTLEVNGANPNGSGQLIVDGTNTSAVLDVNNTIFVNATELSEVLIANRGIVTVPELVIGLSQARPGAAEVTVRGPNARLNVDDTFAGAGQTVQPTVIGRSAAGQLKVEGGAEARLNGGLRVGQDPPGTVIVSSFGAPARSKLRVKGDTTAGDAGRGTIQVGDDALMTVDGALSVGGFAGGTVTISFASFLTVTGQMTLGVLGEGRLTADDFSFVTVHGTLMVGETALGILNVLGGSEARCETLQVGSSVPEGGGTVVLGTASELTITGNAQVGIGAGHGVVLLSEATSVLRIDGTMDIGNPAGGPGGGAVALAGARIEGAGSINVNPNGALIGAGTINLCSVCRVDQGGLISPGLSPGLLTINGNYNQLSSGVLIIEVAGLAPGQFDVLAVNGDVTLGGTLEVRFLDGFLPRQGDRIEFLNLSGSLSNNFTQITFPQAASGFDAELNLTPEGNLGLVARNDAVTGNGATITSPLLVVNTTPRITQFSVNAGQFTLTWTTTPGRFYRVEAKDDLDSQTWTAVSTDSPAVGRSLSLSLDLSDGPRRFYRVAQVDAP